MLSFIDFLTEAIKSRRIDQLSPGQHYPHDGLDLGWIEYLRKHIRSKKSAEAFIKQNPTYQSFYPGVDKEPVTRNVQRDTLSRPIWANKLEYKSKVKTHRIEDGHHRYWARYLEGKKRIKTSEVD